MDNYSYDEEPNSKWPLLGGAVVMILVIVISFGVFYWQKNGKFKNVVDKNFSLLKNGKIAHEDNPNSEISKDSDSDGLLDIDEKFYGTNLNLQDSDGDGYSDGDEVLANFNPLGKGIIAGEYKEKLIKKILNSNNLKDISIKRVFQDKSGHFSFDLFPGWMYYSGGENREFIYEENGKKIIRVTVNKGMFGLADLGKALSQQDKKIDLNSFKMLSYFCCGRDDFENAEVSNLRIDKHKSQKYDYGEEQCYVSHVDSIGGIAKEKTNLCIQVNFYIDEVDNKYKEIAQKFVKSYKDLLEVSAPNVFYSKSKNRANLALCNRIEMFRNRDECFYDMSIRTFDPAYCNLIIGQEKMENCIGKIGDSHNLCNVHNRPACFSELAEATNDEKYCEEVEGPAMKYQCYAKVAVLKKDIYLCEKIPLSYVLRKNTCIKDVAIAINNYKLCENIVSNVTVKSKCYMDIAINLSDYKICENIEGLDNPYKELCVSAANRKKSSQ